MKVIAFLRGFVECSKPSLSRLVVLTTLCGAAVAPGAFTSPGWMHWLLLTFASMGIVGSANVVNCYLERDIDALMERTKNRPLATGKMAAIPALYFALTLATLSLYIFYVYFNPLTAFLAFLGFVSYVALYTPLKRFSMSAVFVGAIPGAIPPVMGWTAMTGKIETGALILFLILFLWQLPHFIAISMNRLAEYELAGLKTVPGSLGATWAFRHIFFYSILLIAASLAPYYLDLAGVAYFAAAIFLGFLFLMLCVAGVLELRRMNWNRIIFIGSVLYLPLVLGVWVIEQSWIRLK